MIVMSAFEYLSQSAHVTLAADDRPVHATSGGREIDVAWVTFTYYLSLGGAELERVVVDLGGFPAPGARWAQRRRSPDSSVMRRFELELTEPGWLRDLAMRYLPSIGGHKVSIPAAVRT